MEDNQTNPIQSPAPAPEVVAPQPAVPTPSGGKSKKKLWIVLAVLAVLLVAGGLVWYFVIRDKETVQNNQTGDNQNNQTQTEQLEGLPDLVAYAHRDDANSPYKLYTRPATGGDRAEVMTLPEGSFISHHAAHGKQLAFVLEPGSNTEGTMFIYYSDDSGKTYERIFTAKARETTDSLGEQITSLIFSSDGKSLVFGLLSYEDGETAGKNKVTEVSLGGSNEAKTLFTSDKAGVFLQGYDRAKQRAVYFTGCYNCDGNVSNPLLVRDGDGAETTLYDSKVGFLNVAVASGFNSVLVSEGTADPAADGLGDTTKAPYAIFTIDIGSKEKKTVAEITEGNVREVGYSTSGDAYAVTEKQVIKLGNEQNALFETTSSISYNGAPFVGEDSVVVQIGDPVGADFSLNYFKLGEAKPVQILTGDGNTVILGVTQK